MTDKTEAKEDISNTEEDKTDIEDNTNVKDKAKKRKETKWGIIEKAKRANTKLESSINKLFRPNPKEDKIVPEEHKFSVPLEELDYELSCKSFAFGFSSRPDQWQRFAIASWLERKENYIEIASYSESLKELVRRLLISQDYATTKIMWIPDENGTYTDLFAASGETLKIWEITRNGEDFCLKAELKNHDIPLTSFDWYRADPRTLGTASLERICTIWDIQKQAVKTQFVAHEKEVSDICFGANSRDVITAGLDGTVRWFDTRSLEYCGVVIQSPRSMPYTKLTWNHTNENLIAMLELGSNGVHIVDLRNPARIYYEISGHSKYVNGIAWGPNSRTEIVTAGDDKQAIIWDLAGAPDNKEVEFPKLVYSREEEVVALQWVISYPNWISLLTRKKLCMLKMDIRKGPTTSQVSLAKTN